MEIRKLQKIKGGSFTLSIPRKWVNKKRLKSGHQMVVSEENDGSLSIYPMTVPSDKPSVVTIDLEELPDIKALEYSIITYYIQGADRIDISSESIIPAEQKRELKLLRLSMPGVDVSEEGANMISFQVLIDPSAFRLETLLQKTSEFSLHLQEDAMTSVLSWDLQLAKEVIERSGEALRHYRLTIRQVAIASTNKKIAKAIGVRNCQECVTFALIARDLSRLVYHCSQIARHVLSLGTRIEMSQPVLDLMKKLSNMAYKMQKEALQSFLKEDIKLSIQVFRMMGDIRKREETLLKKIMSEVKDIDTAVVAGLIVRDLRRIAGYSVAIADDSMNRVLTPTP